MIRRRHDQEDEVEDPARVRMEVVKITPDLAREWLTKNTRNRPMSDARVRRAAKAMERGEWELNGQPIIWNFDETVLLDGQHRLAAVVLSGVTIESLVVWGIDPAAQDSMDTGGPRRLADQLSLRGEKNTKTLQSAIYAVFYLRGRGATNGARTPTHAQAFSFLEAEPEIRTSIPVAWRVRKEFGRFPTGFAAAMHYLFGLADSASEPRDSDQFFEALTTGVGLEDGDPILTLRRQLHRDATATGGRGMDVRHLTAITIKAWVAWRDGREVRLLKWSPVGPNKEPFPDWRLEDPA